MDNRLEKGCFAVSKAGHDCNEIYVIINSDPEYVYLADGRIRTLDKLKKKKIKHIQVIRTIDRNLTEKMEQNGLLINEDIKRAIKLYKKTF